MSPKISKKVTKSTSHELDNNDEFKLDDDESKKLRQRDSPRHLDVKASREGQVNLVSVTKYFRENDDTLQRIHLMVSLAWSIRSNLVTWIRHIITKRMQMVFRGGYARGNNLEILIVSCVLVYSTSDSMGFVLDHTGLSCSSSQRLLLGQFQRLDGLVRSPRLHDVGMGKESRLFGWDLTCYDGIDFLCSWHEFTGLFYKFNRSQVRTR